MIIAPGTEIERYHIVESLGRGGMAEVYKAFDTRLERDVAVKVIRRNAFSPDTLERVLKRFDREAKSLAKLTHPNIVSIIDYGEYEGSPYLVMPYLPGGTLKTRLGSPIPYAEAAAILQPVADGLAYAHQKGIVHRDVKPGNILITEGGQPMLTDFGIARLLENEDTATLTGTGVGIGTPEYMAPEQGLGREVDGRADIYSLGVVFYELVTGRKPYTADTPMAVVLKQSTEPLPKPSSLVSGLPEKVEQVLYKALAKQPDDRFQTMIEFEKTLAGIVKNNNSLDSPTSPSGEKRTEDVVIQEANTSLDVDSKLSISELVTKVEQIPPMPELATKVEQVPPIPELATKSEKIPSIPELPTKVEQIPSIPQEVTKIDQVPPLLSTDSEIPPQIKREKTHQVKIWPIFAVVGAALVIIIILIKVVQSMAPVPFSEGTGQQNQEQASSVSFAINPAETKVCGIGDGSGLNDTGFNKMMEQGVASAVSLWGVQSVFVDTYNSDDYSFKLSDAIQNDCDLIIIVGYAAPDATLGAAGANPDKKFSLVDYSNGQQLGNLVSQVYQSDEAAFLAGYLAAEVTRTGVVGTYGGLNVSAVTSFMDGFARGVAYYNQVHGTAIKVLGWNVDTLEGIFTDSFSDREINRAVASYMIDQGADVIFPVTSTAGFGAAIEVESRTSPSAPVYLIGVDFDWYLEYPEFHDVVLTSVMKNVDVTTKAVIETYLKGEFNGGDYVGTLANGGVGIAPFHDLDNVVSSDFMNELEQVRAAIISGDVAFNPDFRP